jgi:hypothetical protein
LQAASNANTPRETRVNAIEIKNPQGLGQTLRIAPASSSSPVPQPSREQRSALRAGLLADGSPYSPCLPIRKRVCESRLKTVAFTGFVPIHSGGTARDSHPLPLPGNLMTGHNRRERQNLSSSNMSDNARLVHSVGGTEACL